MKVSLFLVVFVASFISKDIWTVNGSNADLDGWVEENPDYCPFSDRGMSDDDDDDDDDSYDETENDSEVETAKERTRFKSINKRAVRFVKKNQIRLIVLITLYAFRRELYRLVHFSIQKHLVDSKNGQLKKPSVTSILKLLVFVDIMRRAVSSGGSTKELPLTAALMFRNPAVGMVLSSLLRPANTAYVPAARQHYTFERVDNRYSRDSMALQKVISMENKFPATAGIGPFPFPLAGAAAAAAAEPRKTRAYKDTVVIMELTGLDASVSRMATLQDQVSFLIREHRTGTLQRATSKGEKRMEVVIKLESPGGAAADYALAASHLLRLRNEEGITVTIAVDKVAASGGYMMACTASPGKLIAASFAVVGSIGVVGQIFNIHDVLQGWGVQPLVFRGGKDKAPLGLVGEVTQEGKQNVQEMIDDTHKAFKRHVASARPILADTIDQYATGKVWLGTDALEIGLVDRIATSDEYLDERMLQGARVLRLAQLAMPKYPFQEPIATTELSSNEASTFQRQLLRFIATAVQSILRSTQKLST